MDIEYAAGRSFVGIRNGIHVEEIIIKCVCGL